MTSPEHQSSTSRIASLYLAFAEREARGRSALYEALARGVADDAAVISFLRELPRPKQQPNLLFAMVKYLYGAPRLERLPAISLEASGRNFGDDDGSAYSD